MKYSLGKNSSANLLALGLFFLFSRGFVVINKLYYLFVVFLILAIIANRKAILQSIKKIYENGLTPYIIGIYVLFFVYASISGFWAEFPIVTLSRSGFFLVLVLGAYSVSSYFKNIDMDYSYIFTPLTLLIILTSAASLLFQIPENYRTGGNGLGLMGFSVHQNTLGSIAFLCGSVFTFYSIKKALSSNRNNMVVTLLLASSILVVILLFMTASRGAIAAFLSFLFFILLLEAGIKRSIIVFGIIGLMFIISLQFEFVKNTAESVIYKNAENIMSSREAMYRASLKGAANGGVFGIGYGMSDTALVYNVPGEMQNGRFIREKGSTLLALVEETGFVGAILFYLPIGILLWKWGVSVERRTKSPEKAPSKKHGVNLDKFRTLQRELSFLVSIIIAMTVHSQIEAWGVGVGSVMLPVYLFFIFRLSRIVGE
ncbi:MAG: O-antigen ligase family protein [Bacteroidota bacterium]